MTSWRDPSMPQYEVELQDADGRVIETFGAKSMREVHVRVDGTAGAVSARLKHRDGAVETVRGARYGGDVG